MEILGASALPPNSGQTDRWFVHILCIDLSTMAFTILTVSPVVLKTESNLSGKSICLESAVVIMCVNHILF